MTRTIPKVGWKVTSRIGFFGKARPVIAPASRAIFPRSAASRKRRRREVRSALPIAGRHALRRSSGRSTTPSPSRWPWSYRTHRRFAQDRRRQPGAGIAYRDKHAVGLGLTGGDQQLARSLADLAHRFDGVHDQVQHHLLQLDFVSQNARQPLRQLHLHQNAMSDIATRVSPIISKMASLISNSPFRAGAFLEKSRIRLTISAARLPSLDNVIDRLRGLFQIWRLTGEPAHGGFGIRQRGGDGLVDFVGDGGREFAHGRDTVRVHQLCLGALSLGQVDDEGDSLGSRFPRSAPRQSAPARGCRPSGNIPSRMAAGSCQFHLSTRPCIPVAPFRRRQVRPAQATRDEILALVSTMPKKRVVGLNDLASRSPIESR